MAKNIKLLFFTLLIGSFIITNVAHALEVKYPNIPGLSAPSDSCTGSACLPQLVIYWFGILIYIAGILSLISFVIGAIGLLAPSVEAHSNAKDRMRGAVLGLVLVTASFIIINTINPILIEPILTPLPETSGVFLTNGSEKRSCPSNQDNIPEGFNTLEYVCDKNNGKELKILVWIYPKKGFAIDDENYSNISTYEVACNSGGIGVGDGSLKWTYEIPGVYYYMDGGCSKFASSANTSSQDEISSPFKGKVGSVKIVNDSDNNLDYGIILHQTPGLKNGGLCGMPISSSGCRGVDISEPSAADIYLINKNPVTSGNKVSFYSESFQDATGARADVYDVLTIKKLSPEEMNYDYTGVKRSDEYKEAYPTFKERQGSIKIEGKYLVGLYSNSLGLNTGYCQTFTKDVPNLSAQPFIAPGGILDSVIIIPTR